MEYHRDKKMEGKLRVTITKAFKQLMWSLEQEPSVILECDKVGDVPDSVIEEIEAWLFKRRQNNGDKNN